jgi:hypothetical protein
MPGPTLPREHGFWVMLSAALLAAILRAPADPGAWLAFAVLLVGTPLVGGAVRYRIRREGVMQLASAGLLGMAGVPVALAGGQPLPATGAMAAAWVGLFVPGALSVRAILAGAKRGGAAARRRYDVWAIGLAIVSTAGVVATGFPLHAVGPLLGVALTGIIAVTAPRPTKLKAVGLALAGAAVVTLVAMTAGSG